MTKTYHLRKKLTLFVCLVKFWVKYTSQDFQASIDDYNNDTDLLRREGIAYPIRGILNYSNPDIYAFPLSRDEDPLSIMQQCHSLIRAASFSHETVDAGDGLQTLPAIQAILESGLQWNPVDLQDSDKTPRDVLVHRLLQSVHDDNAVEALYDDRFVSDDSMFCPHDSHLSEKTAEVNLDGEFWNFNTSTGQSFEEYLKTLNVPVHGFYARTAGDLATLCPCSVRTESECCFTNQDINNGTCMQALKQHVDLDITTQCFPAKHALQARRLLHDHAACQAQPCQTSMLSDLSGVLPTDTAAYFTNDTEKKWLIDALDLLMFPVSGVSLSTLSSSNASMQQALTERHRLLNLTDAKNTISNPLCHQPSSKQVAELGLPVVSALWESPATAACVRYVFERRWLAIATSLQAPAERLARIERDVAVWATRCQVKLQKLSSCRDINAFHPVFVRREGNASATQTCNFTLFDPSGTLALARGPCVVLKMSELDSDYVMYDPYQCVPPGTTVVSPDNLQESCRMFDLFQMLRRSGTDVVDDRAPLLSSDFVQNLETNTTFRARMAFAGGGPDLDFLFPADTHDQQHNHRQCPASVPYWPRAWQYPLGEVVSDTWEYGTGYSTYMAAIVDDDRDDAPIQEVAILPRLLRPEKITQTQSGSSGFCREPSLGMRVVASNVHRVCADFICQEGTITPKSVVEKTCSDTAAHALGAGHGHTLGFLYPFLRPMVHRNSTNGRFRLTDSVRDHPTKKLTDVINLFQQTYGDALELDLNLVTGSQPLEDYVRSKCSFDAYLDQVDQNITRECDRNDQCGAYEACTAEGRCANLTLTVNNEAGDEDIEFGMTARGCETRGGADAVAGASPWQKVAGFLHAHGFCAHKEAVTFERMLEVFQHYARMGRCRNESSADGNETWVACPRSAEYTGVNTTETPKWDWINHPPEAMMAAFDSLDENFRAVYNKYLYEYSADEAREPLDVDEIYELWQTEHEFLRLQPHLCDMEYQHARNLGWVHLAGGGENRWMRMAEKFSEVVLPTARTRAPTADGMCKENIAGQRECSASSKMRFMGLTSANLQYFHDKQTQEVVTDGKSCGLCATELFTYGGTRLPRVNYKAELKSYQDTLLCGAFGDTDGTATNCRLDEHTAVFLHVYFFGRGGQSTCKKMMDAAEIKQGLTADHAQHKITYQRDNKEKVTTTIEKIFTFDPDVWVSNPATMNERQRRHDFLQCVDEIIEYKASIKPAFIALVRNFSEAVDGKGYTRGLNLAKHLETTSYVSGMYHFTVFNTYEVPMLYWQKLGLETYVHVRAESHRLTSNILLNWKTNDHTDPAYQQFAWEARFGHAIHVDPLGFSGVNPMSNVKDVVPESALHHRLVSPDEKFRDVKDSVRAAWAALNTKQLVPEQSEFFRYFGKGIARFIAEYDNAVVQGLYQSKYELGAANGLRLAETAHVPESVARNELLQSKAADFRGGFSVLVNEARSRQVPLQQFKTAAAVQGLYTLENQYHQRAIAPSMIKATHWVYHGTGAPRSLYTQPNAHANEESVCASLIAGNLHIAIQSPQWLPVGAWINCNGQIFTPWSEAATDDRPLFALDTSAVDVQKHRHQFVGDIIQDLFFGTDSASDQPLRVKYFDPSEDARYAWDEESDNGANEALRQELGHGRLPLAILKLETSASSVTSKQKDAVLDKLLEQHSRRADNQCHQHSLENQIALPRVPDGTEHQRCVWNPLQRQHRKTESELDRSRLDGRRSDITITAGGAEFTWNLCRLNDEASRHNGYATPGSSVRDGPSCSFADLAEAEEVAGRISSKHEQEDCTGASIFCDYKLTPRTSVNYKHNANEPVQAQCRIAERAQHHDLQNRPTTVVGLAQNDVPVVADMYLDERVPPSDWKRPRKKLCHRIDSGCVAQAESVQEPYNKLFKYEWIQGTTKARNTVEMRYDQLRRNAGDQVDTRVVKERCASNPGATFKLYDRTDGTWKSKSCEDMKEPYEMTSKGISDMKTTHKKKKDDTSRPFVRGPQCNVHTIKVPEKAKIRAWRLNPKLREGHASFSHVTFSDRVQVSKEGDNVYYTKFQHHFHEDRKSFKDRSPHTTPTPSHSFCGDPAWAEKGLHKFKLVDFNHGHFRSRILSPWNQFNFEMGIDSKLEATDKNNEYNANQYNTMWDHSHKVEWQPAFDKPTNNNANDNFKTSVCSPPMQANPGTWDIWDLATCYENDSEDLDENDNAPYTWAVTSLCDLLMNVMEGTLSRYFFNHLSNRDGTRNGRDGFLFTELFTGSQNAEAGGANVWTPAMSKDSWDDVDIQPESNWGDESIRIPDFEERRTDNKWKVMFERMFGMGLIPENEKTESEKETDADVDFKRLWKPVHGDNAVRELYDDRNDHSRARTWMHTWLPNYHTAPYIPGFFLTDPFGQNRHKSTWYAGGRERLKLSDADRQGNGNNYYFNISYMADYISTSNADMSYRVYEDTFHDYDFVEAQKQSIIHDLFTENIKKPSQSFWQDFASLRNLKHAESVCACQEQTPLARKKRDGGVVFLRRGIRPHRRDKTDGETADFNWRTAWPTYQKRLPESAKDDNADPNTMTRFFRYQTECWDESVRDKDYLCEWLEVDLYSRGETKVLDDAECSEYCRYEYSLLESTPLSAGTNSVVMSKLMGQHLARPASRQSWKNYNENSPFNTIPMILAPCIEGQLDHDSHTMDVGFYRSGFFKSNEFVNRVNGDADEDVYENDNVGKPNGEYRIWDENAKPENRRSYDRVSRTLLRTLFDANTYDQNSVCWAGGRRSLFVPKPSQWAEIDARPQKMLVPCKPDEADSDACHDILEEITVDNSTYMEPVIDGYRYFNHTDHADSAGAICTYEIELPEDTHTECEYEPDTCARGAGQRPCSLYVEDAAESCYFEPGPRTREQSLLAVAKNDRESMLVSCSECVTYDPSMAVLNASTLAEQTCLGRGLYRVDSSEVHFASRSYDRDDLHTEITNVQQRVLDVFADDTRMANLATELEAMLQTQDFRMTDNGLEDRDKKRMKNIRVTKHHNATSATHYLLVSLNVSTPDFFAGTTKLTDGVQFWNRVILSGGDEKYSGYKETFSALQTPTEPPRFQRFDMITALNNAKDIQADYETGCSQDPDNIQNALDADECKAQVDNETTVELRALLKNLYEREFGLRLPRVPAGERANLSVARDQMQNFSWYDGLLPWWSKATRDDRDSIDDSPFLQYITSSERCQQEFASGEFSPGARPCFRDANGSAGILLPFYADRYAWPKRLSSSKLDSGFGIECKDVESCERYVNARLQTFEKFMIGTDVCLQRDDINVANLFREQACFASFCTDFSPLGTKDTERCFNATHKNQPCESELEGTSACPCELVNSLHVNKTLCKFTPEAINQKLQNEFPDKPQMSQIRQLFVEGKFRRWKPSFGRCAARFANVSQQYQPPTRTATCKHKQAPIGYSNHQARTFLAGKFAPTLARTHEIAPASFAPDRFAMSRLRSRQTASLWLRDNIQRVLGDRMAYPVATGSEQYALLALDPAELAPVDIEMRSEEDGGMQPFRVHTVYLTASRAGNHTEDWMQALPSSFDADQHTLDKSALHSGNATTTLGWACPFVLAGVLSGSRRIFADHPSVRLLTPGPGKMRELYPKLNGLHPLVKLREVNISREIRQYPHLGFRSIITNNQSNFSLEEELALFFDQSLRCRKVTGVDPAALKLGVPDANYTLRSGEKISADANNFPAELLQLLQDFSVAIQHAKSMEPVYAMFAMHHPYQDMEASNRTRTTLDRGGECHKSRLTRIPRATLQQMLAYDACSVTAEDGHGTRRNVTCTNATHARVFALRTAALRDVPAGEWFRYRSCRAEQQRPRPNYTAYAGPQGESITLQKNELSLSKRRRISPLWRRLSDLKHSNISLKFDDIQDDNALKQLWLDSGTSGSALRSSTTATVSGVDFDSPWMHECPPNSGKVTGKISEDTWRQSLQRENHCHTDDAGCDLDKSIDLCKIAGLEDLCVALRQYQDRIRRANMQRVGLIETSVALYTPSSFYQQEGRYAWEMVAAAYDKMKLVKPLGDSACKNVLSAEDVVQFDTIGAAGASASKCPGNALMYFAELSERLRSVVLKFVNLVIHLVDAGTNIVVGFVSMLAPMPGDSRNVVTLFMQRAMGHLRKAWEIIKDFVQELANILIMWLFESPEVQAVMAILSAACQIFKAWIQYVLFLWENILRAIRDVQKFLGINLYADVLEAIINELTDTRMEVNSWNCGINLPEACPFDTCDQVYQVKLADTCYTDVVADVGPLGGDLTGLDSTTWIGKARGAYTCNSASYCRDTYGTVVFCEDCGAGSPDRVVSEYHCAVDNRCTCGAQTTRVDACFVSSDCGPARACQILDDGLARATGTTSCAPRQDFRALCIKEQPEDARGTCAQVLHYDTTALQGAGCDPSAGAPGLPAVDGFCLFSPEALALAAGAEFGDLFVSRCENAASRSEVCLPVAFPSGLLGDTQPPLRVYSVDFDRFARRRRLLVASGDDFTTGLGESFGGNFDKFTRRPLSGDDPTKKLTDVYIKHGREQRHPHLALRAFVSSLAPRMPALAGDCAGVFAQNLALAEHAERALACAQWLLVANATLEGTGLRDVDVPSWHALWNALRHDPDLFPQVARNVPRALAAYAADASDAPLLQLYQVTVRDTGKATQRLRGVWRLLAEGRDKTTVTEDLVHDLFPAQHTRDSYHLFAALTQVQPEQRHGKNNVANTGEETTNTEATVVTARRRLLQESPFENSAVATTQSMDDVHQKGNRRRLLEKSPFENSTVATATAYAGRVDLARVDDDQHRATAISTAHSRLRAPDDSPSPACSINTGSRVVGYISAQLRVSLRRHGWSELPECNTDDLAAWAAFFQGSCPAAEVVVGTVAQNVLTLIQYYAALNASGCLSDPDKSCLPPPLYTRGTAADAFPLIHRETATGVAEPVDDEREPVVTWFVRGLKEFLSLLSLGSQAQQEVIWGFFSLKAAYQDKAYEEQVAENSFSVGRILRETLTCDFEESLTCSKVRSPLLPSFFAVFFFLLLFTTFLPVPSVVTFFLWVIGLTTGVTYLAYAFSPLCWPAVPLCFGEGFYDVVQILFPARIDFPRDGQVHQACPNLGIQDTFSTIIAIETVFRQGRATWSYDALHACVDLARIDACEEGLTAVGAVEQNVLVDSGGVGVYYCIFFNLYRLGVFLCIIILLAPVILYTVALVVPIVLQGVRLALLSVSSVVGMYHAYEDDDDVEE